MDKLFDQLSDIENSASGIMEEANRRKAAFAREMEEKTKAFDQELEKETGERIRQVREAMEREKIRKLQEQKENSEKLLAQMERNYEEYGDQYAEELFRDMIKE